MAKSPTQQQVGRHGGRSRELQAHVLNYKHKTERANKKWPEF